MLARRPAGFLPHGRGHLDFAELYADAEQQLADALPSLASHTEDTISATAVAEIHENIADALLRAGLPIGLLMQFLVEEPQDFISALPTRAAALRLREARHRNAQKSWEPNDMNDVAYSACAIVHCHVVVTENLWADMLRQSGLPKDHRATVTSDLTRLPNLLAA